MRSIATPRLLIGLLNAGIAPLLVVRAQPVAADFGAVVISSVNQKWAEFPFLAFVMSASNTACSFSESPAGTGPPVASAAATSGGMVAGKLRWMPSNPAGAWRAIALEMGAPQSPPWAT